MSTYYATFALGGPLKNCYGKVESGEGEIIVRQWLKLHFPIDWAGIYRPEEFIPQVEKYELREVFAVTL